MTDLYAALLADARKPTTRAGRRWDVADLDKFLGSPTEGGSCLALVSGGSGQANAIATAYLRSMLDKKLSAATINRRLSTLRVVIKLARKFELITWALEIDSLKVESFRDTRGPGRGGWLQLLDKATRAARLGAKGRRDLAIIRLLHDHGLRRSEVVSLELADWDAEGTRLAILGKGKTARSWISVNPATCVALMRWIADRGPDPGPLFTRLNNGRPKEALAGIGGRTVEDLVRGLGKEAGLAAAVRPHGLRHQGITRVLELNNGNIDSAQKFARHADPKTTQKYNDNRADVAGEMARLLGDDA
jgi:integrase/recombinase XerC